MPVCNNFKVDADQNFWTNGKILLSVHVPMAEIRHETRDYGPLHL